MDLEKFCVSLNKIHTLMSENKLREDMDDSLLEKLLSLIKDGIREETTSSSRGKFGFVEVLLNSTQFSPLAEKVMFSLTDSKIKLHTSVKVYTLRLVGLVCENESIFSSQKSSVFLKEFSKACRSRVDIRNNRGVALAPSIQDAVLSCIFSISKHPDGTIWIVNEKLLDYAFSSFSSTSYYVRKTAVRSLTEALALWTSPEFSSFLMSQQFSIDDTIKQILSEILCGIECQLGGPTLQDENTTYNECCMLTLKQALETANIRTFIDNLNFDLVDKIMKYFSNVKNVSKHDLLHENVLQILLAMYSSDPELIEASVKRVIEILTFRHMFNSAMNVATSFISISEKYKPLTSAHLQWFCSPLLVYSAIPSDDFNKNPIYLFTNPSYVLMEELENKSSCVQIITTTINSLSKLTEFMDALALEKVLKSIEMVAKGPESNQSDFVPYLSQDNRNICLATLELFSCFLRDTVYSTMNVESQVLLMDYMLSFLERPSSDCNILSEDLKLLKCHTELVAKRGIELPGELKEKLTMLLCRKLLDNKEPVVDNALQLAGEIIGGKGYAIWKEGVMKHNIHMIVWEIAIEGRNDGYVKATALKAITEGCLIQYYWEDIKSTKKVDEIGVMEILCRYFHNPDFFIQRESLSCIHKWFQSNEQLLSEYNPKIFSILFCAVKSLDLELKLSALDMWQWLLSGSSISDITKYRDINDYMETLYNIGFIACALIAIEDYDNAVQFSAAKILVNLRQTLIQMGHTGDSLTMVESQLETTQPTELPNGITKPISEAERDAGIETVLNISTTEQLTNIYCKTVEESFQNVCHCNDFSNVATDPVLFNIKSFWTYLWCDKLDAILNPNENSSSVFSAQSLSILDDIIASEETEVNHCADDGLDCY